MRYSLEPSRRGGTNEYPQSMFLSRNKKNNLHVYPGKPQFYYIKVGLKWVNIIKTCFRDEACGSNSPINLHHFQLYLFSVVFLPYRKAFV